MSDDAIDCILQNRIHATCYIVWEALTFPNNNLNNLFFLAFLQQ